MARLSGERLLPLTAAEHQLVRAAFKSHPNTYSAFDFGGNGFLGSKVGQRKVLVRRVTQATYGAWLDGVAVYGDLPFVIDLCLKRWSTTKENSALNDGLPGLIEGIFASHGAAAFPWWRGFCAAKRGDSKLPFRLPEGNLDNVAMLQFGGDRPQPAFHTTMQLNALRHLFVHGEQLWKAVERAAAAQLARGDTADLHLQLELMWVYVHTVGCRGVSYVGFAFQERGSDRGIGVLTNRTRVVAAGDALTASISELAARDRAARMHVGMGHDPLEVRPLAPDEKSLTRADAALRSKRISLRAWAGFLDCSGSYEAVSSNRPSTGRVALTVRGEPGEKHRNAVCFLLELDERVRDATLRALLANYPVDRMWVAPFMFDKKKLEQCMPSTLSEPDHFRPFIGLTGVYVHDTAWRGCSYVGLTFGCSWQDEHGLGVVLHQDRVIAVGDWDTAASAWSATFDLKARKAARRDRAAFLRRAK